MSHWIDISIPLYSGMVHWPGDASVSFDHPMVMGKGDVCNTTYVSMSAHTGTHMDAPLHFIDGGSSIDSMPLEATVGTARIIEIRDESAVTASELEAHDLQAGERVLFKTVNSSRCWKDSSFHERFVHISAPAARYLAEKKVRTVGIDYLSVGAYEGDGIESHQALLAAGIWLIEGLNLSAVTAGLYDLVCLPLKIVGADGAPARAILRGIGTRV
ncbi:MAG TPA: cyclase family protein [Bryobacteraceae bacterium]|nr:cyclase family protein [Bryobacteraceae bacterium]